MTDISDVTAQHNEWYRLVEHQTIRRMERRVLGRDYGATSYTTRDQADQLARMLGLGSQSLALISAAVPAGPASTSRRPRAPDWSLPISLW